jgi:hypothetical protein
MGPSQAQRVIEALRKGIPPDGYVTTFTVGRQSEIDVLRLKANYGAGKTHLLRFVREAALKEGYVVSLIALDAKSAIRFNRMDQILGAICRSIELPDKNQSKGIRSFFNQVCLNAESAKREPNDSFWKELTNNWQWKFSQVLDSKGLFVALRAWATGNNQAQDLVEDWFLQPWTYNSQTKRLYVPLVEQLRGFFRDPRSLWQFYQQGIFHFALQGYSQSWAILRDIHKLSLATGFKGFVILFDEFEDVIHNLKRVDHQEAAFWNLFTFYDGREFPGMSFFAVTPDFVRKSKRLLLEKNRWDYDFSRFDTLPTFEMSPLSEDELQELAIRILEAHGTAYEWEPDLAMKMLDLKAIVRKASSIQVQDRARHAIRQIVQFLDELLEDRL